MNNQDDFTINTVFEKYTGTQKEVMIPDGITSIGHHAFLFLHTKTIRAAENSAAADYAKRNNIKLQII